MHLFIIESFISIDMLSPIIKELDKRKVIICNINPIQNHKQNELVDFFIKNGFRYFNSLPLDKTKIIIFLFLKTLIFLPCFIQFKFRYLFKKFNFEYSFTSKIKGTFLILRNFDATNANSTGGFPINAISGFKLKFLIK